MNGNKKRRLNIQKHDYLPARFELVFSPNITIMLLSGWYAWMFTWSNWWVYSWFINYFRPNLYNLVGFYKFMIGMVLHGIHYTQIAFAIWNLTLAGIIFLSAFIIGKVFLCSIGIDRRFDGSNLWALGVGLGTLSHGLLLLGLLGLWVPTIMVTVILTPLVFGIFFHHVQAAQWIREKIKSENIPTVLEVSGLFLVTSYVILNFLATQGPEFFYDSLVYHLALPKLYLLHRGIIATPSIIYSGIPFGTEMLFGLSLAIADERLAKLIHFCFGIAIMAVIYDWCKSRIGRTAAILAILLFYCTRMSMYESWVSQVELSWTFYTILSLLVILKSLEPNCIASRRVLLVVAGILGGFAISTKYNAALYVIALALPLVFDKNSVTGRNFWTRTKEVAIFLCTAFFVVSPWLLKNILFYKNPVYPFFAQFFFHNNTGADVKGLMNDAHSRDLYAAFTTWTGLKDLFCGIFLPTWSLSDSIGMTTLIAFPWVFVIRWGASDFRLLKITLFGAWVVWALTTRMPRFLLPVLPIFCILAATAIAANGFPQIVRRISVIVIYCISALSFGGAFVLWHQQGLWRVALGISDKTTFLSHQSHSYGVPYYAGTKFINDTLPTNAKILFLGEERGYYCDRKFVTASVFDINPIENVLNSTTNADQLKLQLQKNGISHLLINKAAQRYYDWLARMRPEIRRNYDALLDNSQLIFSEKRNDSNDRMWVEVYCL